MAEVTLRGPKALSPLAARWHRLSPRLVPLFAVLTALILSSLFMMLTQLITKGQVDLGTELNKTGTAYNGLIEGSIGLTLSTTLTNNSIDQARIYVSDRELGPRDLTRSARTADEISRNGFDNITRFGEVLSRYPDLTDEEIIELSARLGDIQRLGDARLDSLRPLVTDLDAVISADRDALFASLQGQNSLTSEQRSNLDTLLPSAVGIADADLLTALQLIGEEGLGRLKSLLAQLDVLQTNNLTSDSPDARDLAAIGALDPAKVRDQVSFAGEIQDLGLLQPDQLAHQLRIIKDLYDAEPPLLLAESVSEAVKTEFEPMLQNNLVILRPNNQIVIDRAPGLVGIIYAPNKTPDDPSDDHVVDLVYLKLGTSALLFYPSNLESMLVRSIPFIIAGLAMALGFKAGLFNIGAEGQLYAGGTIAAWVGFSPAFAGLPPLLHLGLVLIAGIIGGLIWGAIPGLLKAFTGAHEVINTIMLNFIAILTVDWLIKSTDPVIFLDTTASAPRTPYIVEGARLPTFNNIAPWIYVAAGIVVLLLGLYSRRAQISKNISAAIRPVLYGIITIVGGLFLSWVATRGALHIGFLVMLGTVWFTEWFLDRTTAGFEIRTVGANPDAARYAGMNVRFNIVLAIALAGALAGLAGAIEVAGVQFNMQPGFFGGVGFDAIAVALLARSNPRAMIPAGLLWGALLAGAGLMQTRAAISIDLVKIIQALIIMFIAADAIIRYLWRVPDATAEEKEKNLFSAKGWGG